MILDNFKDKSGHKFTYVSQNLKNKNNKTFFIFERK